MAWRLQSLLRHRSGFQARPVPALHVQLQDAIGAPVTAVGAAVGLTFLFAGTSPTVDFDCPGSFSRPLTNGQAVFEGCDITGTGRGYFRLSAAGLVPAVTRAFLFGNLQRRVAPLVAHGP